MTHTEKLHRLAAIIDDARLALETITDAIDTLERTPIEDVEIRHAVALTDRLVEVAVSTMRGASNAR